jgi:dTDP-4-dehydrorhamnose reductase
MVVGSAARALCGPAPGRDGVKVLVIGREGQLSSSLARRGAGHPWLQLAFAGRPVLDLERPETIEAAVAQAMPDAIVNAAAYTAVDRAEDETDLAFRINAEGAGAVARAAAARDIPIIQISTDYVFDGSAREPYREDAPLAPINVYGRSKAAGEQQVRDAAADHLIVRTSWVYSPFGHNFLKTMLRLGESNDEVTVVGDQVGSPTSALDLADGLIAALAHWNGGARTGLGATYHLAGSGFASWFEFAQEIFRDAADAGLAAARVRQIATADWPTPARRPVSSKLDSSRFRADFGFQMPAWQDSVREVIAMLARARTPSSASGTA